MMKAERLKMKMELRKPWTEHGLEQGFSVISA